jgi:tetratricopeptide (TPR) repeat protein
MPASARSWRSDLRDAVDEALEQPCPSSDAVDGCIVHARRVDLGDESDVGFALGELTRVIDGFPRSEAARAATDTAGELALAALRATGNPGFVGELARQLRERGLTGAGLALLEAAIEADQAAADPGRSAATSILLNAKGEALREIGRWAEAEAAYVTALAAIKGDSPSDDAGRSAVLNNLGLVCHAKGDLLQARTHLIRSLELEKELAAESVSVAITLDNLGEIEADLAREAGPLWLTDEYVNAVVAEHLDQAEDYLDRAAEQFEAALPAAAADYVVNLLHKADVARQKGDSAKRELLSRRALEIASQNRVPVATMWEVVRLRGEVLLADGQPEEAVALLTGWFDRLRPIMEPHEGVSRGLVTLLTAAARVGDQQLVDDVAQTIDAIDTRVLQWRLAGASESEARHAFAPLSSRTELILGHCLPAATSGIAPRWVYVLWLNRKGVLAERLGSSWLQARLAEGQAPDLLARIRELRAEVARVDLDGSGSTAIRRARQQHEETERRLSTAEGELQRELGQLQSPIAHVDVGDIQTRLDAETMLLDLASATRPDGSRHYIVFEVRVDGPIRYRDLGPVDELDGELRALVAEAETPAGHGAQLARSTAMAGDVAPALLGDGHAENLLISPTGMWGRVPFAMLRGGDGLALIDAHVITLIPSARWMATRAGVDGDDARRGPPVVLGDPDLDLDFFDQVDFYLSMRFPRLEHAGNEVKDVGSLLGVDPALQREATRQRLLDVARPQVLHVATHGVFLDAIGSIAEQREPREWQLRSIGGTVVSEDSDELGWTARGAGEKSNEERALHRSRAQWLEKIGPAAQLSRSALLLTGFHAWLAGVTTPPDVGMGLVSAGEFALLDLTTTELVVLSACETGVGAVDYADGSLLGLRTAALAAGAASCVSTLWKVGDETAATLISAFYRRLLSGSTRASALRSAQLAVRERFPDPYSWAGWVLEGDSGPLSPLAR